MYNFYFDHLLRATPPKFETTRQYTCPNPRTPACKYTYVLTHTFVFNTWYIINNYHDNENTQVRVHDVEWPLYIFASTRDWLSKLNNHDMRYISCRAYGPCNTGCASVKPVFHGACFETDSAPILYAAPYTRRVRPCLARIRRGQNRRRIRFKTRSMENGL